MRLLASVFAATPIVRELIIGMEMNPGKNNCIESCQTKYSNQTQAKMPNTMRPIIDFLIGLIRMAFLAKMHEAIKPSHHIRQMIDVTP